MILQNINLKDILLCYATTIKHRYNSEMVERNSLRTVHRSTAIVPCIIAPKSDINVLQASRVSSVNAEVTDIAMENYYLLTEPIHIYISSCNIFSKLPPMHDIKNIRPVVIISRGHRLIGGACALTRDWQVDALWRSSETGMRHGSWRTLPSITAKKLRYESWTRF
jgi:hypothetical protein